MISRLVCFLLVDNESLRCSSRKKTQLELQRLIEEDSFKISFEMISGYKTYKGFFEQKGLACAGAASTSVL